MSRPWISLPTDPLKVYFDMCIIKYFLKMTRHLAADQRFKDIGEIFRAPLEVRFEYFCELINSCLVSPTHAKKFLHIIRNAGVEDNALTHNAIKKHPPRRSKGEEALVIH